MISVAALTKGLESTLAMPTLRSYSFGCGFFRKFHTDQFETVPGKFPELAGIFWRNKGISHKVKLVEVSNPFGIFFVCFLAFDGFDILWMRETDLNVIFKIIKNRNPILSSRFHANVIAMILNKPVVKPLNI